MGWQPRAHLNEVGHGGKPVTIGAGELALMPANVPHAVNANTRFKMLLIMLRELPVAK